MADRSILDILSLEVVELVVQESRKCDRKGFHDLRLVCKALNKLVEPQVFSTVTIQFEKDETEKWKSIPEFLTSLVSGTSPYDSGIHLQELNVGPLLQPIIDYLLSYSGLREFVLDPSDWDNEDNENVTHQSQDHQDDENIAHQFFHSVLPMHQSTIQTVAFRNTNPGSWAIAQPYLEGVFLCKNLESLTLVYHFPIEEDNRPPTIALADLLSKISDNLPRLQTLRLCHTRKHEIIFGPDTIERSEYTRLVSRLFLIHITGSKSHFPAKRQPQFILHAAGSTFISAPAGLGSGSGHYRFELLYRDDQLDGPVYIDDEGFY
ncbi:hypothetical protein EST38_g6490 [Candolleomyces aberdarensis]|uniref:Uncharacterized protein n=1 Tax=Candolleomyces aberdarensis TaxID=2316362 RepID=A0A4Q2DJQ7_9AGAR|nr:hypothetical protein EST38_g6490 [Candolleomyces aberdarensis]